MVYTNRTCPDVALMPALNDAAAISGKYCVSAVSTMYLLATIYTCLGAITPVSAIVRYGDVQLVAVLLVISSRHLPASRSIAVREMFCSSINSCDALAAVPACISVINSGDGPFSSAASASTRSGLQAIIVASTKLMQIYRVFMAK
jgi:hypothetical protein